MAENACRCHRGLEWECPIHPYPEYDAKVTAYETGWRIGHAYALDQAAEQIKAQTNLHHELLDDVLAVLDELRGGESVERASRSDLYQIAAQTVPLNLAITIVDRLMDFIEGEKWADPDYSPAYQDEYQRLWHEAAARNEKLLDQVAERIKALPTGEGDGDGGAIIYDFRAMVLEVLREMRGDDD